MILLKLLIKEYIATSRLVLQTSCIICHLPIYFYSKIHIMQYCQKPLILFFDLKEKSSCQLTDKYRLTQQRWPDI